MRFEPWRINLESQEGGGEGWISFYPPGQPSAADTVVQVEMDARERKVSERENEVERSIELLKQKEQQVNSKEHELSRLKKSLDEREKQLGLLENLTDNMLDS
jgi:hypothetical protein